MNTQSLHHEELDSQTPVEAYIGRMVIELLKAGRKVKIESIIENGNLLFTAYNPSSMKEVCLQKQPLEIDLLVRPLNAANYDSEEMVNHRG